MLQDSGVELSAVLRLSVCLWLWELCLHIPVDMYLKQQSGASEERLLLRAENWKLLWFIYISHDRKEEKKKKKNVNRRVEEKE